MLILLVYSYIKIYLVKKLNLIFTKVCYLNKGVLKQFDVKCLLLGAKNNISFEPNGEDVFGLM